MDAVNELKGIFSNTRDTSKNDEYLYFCPCEERYTSRNHKGGHPSRFKYVCTREEFNDLVSQLETNFGESESYSNYKVNYEMINDDMKPVIDIDWSKAPEGATHYNPSDYAELCKFYKIINGEYKYYYRDAWCKSTCEIGTLKDKLIERPQPQPSSPLDFGAVPDVKPIFTQSMSDNGEFPQVGMEVEVDGTGVVYVIVLPKDSEGDFILTPKNGDKYWQRSNVQFIKPIDTRTDKEKAVDDIRKITMPDKLTEVEWDIVAAIRSGQITGVKWVGE